MVGLLRQVEQAQSVSHAHASKMFVRFGEKPFIRHYLLP